MGLYYDNSTTDELKISTTITTPVYVIKIERTHSKDLKKTATQRTAKDKNLVRI